VASEEAQIAMPESTNAAERRRWNDDYWTLVWPRREQLTAVVTDLVLDHARLVTGSRVLDIGPGAGISSISAAGRVGGSGSVTGADISIPLVAFATRRAEELHLANVEFVVVDMQGGTVDRPPFDAAISQFGVMFFDEPTAAFANIRKHLRPGASFTFACWQPLDRNLWHINHVLAPFLTPTAAPAPGRSPTGPFSLGSPDRTTAILVQAGWNEIERDPLEVTAEVERDAIFDDGQLRFLGVNEDQVDEALTAVEGHLAGLQLANGRYGAALAIQIYVATA
jgi:SAM-dependent methyltransferase